MPSSTPDHATQFKNRSVLITGGGTGIGLAIARGFAAAGARVAICARDLERLKKAATAIQGDTSSESGAAVMPIQLDVSNRDGCETCADKIAAEFGGIDILINNAGVAGQTPITSEFDETMHEIVETNLVGLFYLTRAVLPHMQDEGRIINIASVLAKFGVPGYTAYCATKHGTIGFTRALALELAPRKITVNAICPGWVDTAMARQGVEETAGILGITPEAFRQDAESKVPLGRFMNPEEVAPLVMYMASREAAMMTGQSVNLDGGQAMW
jgi:NAD(P)-dependent dehydrogenase (short-subunit alcohol dehydrogenase family)